MWFELKGDERLKSCATEGCGGQPTWRLETGGVGSDYCSGCKEKIDRWPTSLNDYHDHHPLRQTRQDEQ